MPRRRSRSAKPSSPTEFKKKGLEVVAVDRKSFADAVLKNAPLESMGFSKSDYDKIVAIK